LRPVLVLATLVIVCSLPLLSVAHAQEPFDAEAATDAYLAQVSAEDRASSDAYFEGGYWLILWGTLYGLAVYGWLLHSGWSVKMRDLAERVGRGMPWLVTAVYAWLFVALTSVLEFPWAVYTNYFREHQYGLATQTFGPWFREALIGLGLGMVIAPLLLIPLYRVFRRAPQTWWVWGTAVTMAFVVLGMLLAPVYIMPLFNTYQQVTDPAIADPILSMARANGVPVDNVYQFDASLQSTRISANVSGFGSTMRVSLNDNLLNRTSQAEIEAVMGHELGHYVLNHVYEGLVFFLVLIGGGFAFVRWSFDRVRNGHGASWGIRGIGDVAGLPLLIVLFNIYGFVLTPVLNSYIRVNEAEADAFGLNVARQPEGFAEVSLKLGEYRKLDPGPWEEMLFFDHPSGRSRIRMAMQWKAEHLEPRFIAMPQADELEPDLVPDGSLPDPEPDEQ
jgi:STE24 endopeptidase